MTDSPDYENRPEWSPDGLRLGFHVSANGDQDRIATMRMDGATPLAEPILGPPSPWFVWSPDGTELLWLDSTATFHTVGRDFERYSKTLGSVVDGQILCKPSWQRLQP